MRRFLHTISSLCLLTTALSAAGKPNILIILADDMGWGDPACQGTNSLVPTPNMDSLAARGMRFTDAYCPAQVCSPTRFSLLTGTYPWRDNGSRKVLANWEPPAIKPAVPTLPGFLSSNGYDTIGIGKWHLGATWATSDGQKPVGQGDYRGTGANLRIDTPITHGPLSRGFSSWWGMICSSEQFLIDGDRIAGLVTQDLYQKPQAPGTDKLPQMDTAQYFTQIFDRASASIRAGKDKPWFLYVAPYAPHVPLTPPGEFNGKTKAGLYGDYVFALDHGIGRLLSALDETGQADNTVVIVTSDNGSMWKTTGKENLSVKPDTNVAAIPGRADDMMHHPNGPLRNGKWSEYEGGVRTPLFIRWPKHVAASSTHSGIVGLNDLFATVADLIGQAPPNGAGRDSISFADSLLGKPLGSQTRKEMVLGQAGGSLRAGQWKLRGEELYDLKADPSETTNCAATQPEEFARLKALHLQIRGPFTPKKKQPPGETGKSTSSKE